MRTRTFDLLTPHVVIDAVETAHDLRLDGTMLAYSSYVNRVYGLTSEDGVPYVAKFYRPGRWDAEAILEEHRFVQDCLNADVPVVAPIPDEQGDTLASVAALGPDSEEEFDFALFPKRSGRSFDAESEEDWIRLGALVGRIHQAAALRKAPHRLICTPHGSSRGFVEELRSSGVVPATVQDDFFALIRRGLREIEPAFEGVTLQRIHGDCHRGNILDRPGEGLLIIDFDDMMMGPPVQDLWLLLPDRMPEARRELNLILEGYERFCAFDQRTLRLIEPLRFMRMVYYLAWSARQRDDRSFRLAHPQWGTEAFWTREIEDLRTQIEILQEEG